MCGIAGLALKPGESVEQSVLERMGSLMANRGPDSAGSFARGEFGLVHRRLKVIDLSSAADQPMFNETRDLAVVFNGEIYNYRELREELELAGHQFKTRSDTEVIVHGFEQWGIDVFRRFNGMFAFAIWDGRAGRAELYLVRDRFGIKPLFYSTSNGRLAFASELKPLLTLDWVDRDVDPQTLFYFLKFSHVSAPRAMIRGAAQLPAGSWLRFSRGSVDLGSFWNSLELADAKPEARSERELLDELDQVFSATVRRQLVSDVPIGCFLSGGIDSSLLVAACHDAGVRDLQTFSVGYESPEFDETSHAEEVAKIFNTRHHSLRLRPADYFGIIPDIPEYCDQPLADPTLLSTLLLARHARGHVTVALSGDGGDELFFGYPYQHALLLLEQARKLPTRARAVFASALARLLPSTRNHSLQRLKKITDIMHFENDAELFQYFIGTFGPMQLGSIASLLAGSVCAQPALYESLMHELDGLSWKDKVDQVFLKTFLTDTVLAKTDRAGMAFGLEARVPFLDDELVAFSARVPFAQKFKGAQGKLLLRKLLLRKLLERKLAGRGPAQMLVRRKKQGFTIPLRDWLRGELRFLLDENLSEQRLKREGIFNAHAVAALVREHRRGFANHSHLLWSLVSFQMWKERYLP